MSAQEGVDFVILPDNVWKYLYEIYDGLDIPRYSIEIETDNDDGSKEYVIEIFKKKVLIFILPKKNYH